MSQYGSPPPAPPPPPGGGYGYQPYGQPGPSQPPRKGFFAALFDFSFTSFVGPSIIKVLYGLIMVAIGLGWLGFTIAGFAASPAAGILFLVGGAIVAVVYLAFARLAMEFYFAVFRVADDVQVLRRRAESRP